MLLSCKESSRSAAPKFETSSQKDSRSSGIEDGSGTRIARPGQQVTSPGQQGGDEQLAPPSDSAASGDSGGSTQIEYPKFKFVGDGTTTCKGDSYPTVGHVLTSIDEKSLTMDLKYAKLHCGSKCEDRAQEEIDRAKGPTVYRRLTQEEKDSWQGKVDMGAYAFFATAVEAETSGKHFDFEKPIPIYPFPGPASRYEVLRESKRWTTKVSGIASFTLHVDLQVLSPKGAKNIRLKITTTIDEDQAGELYELFTMPKEAIYELDSESREAITLDSKDLYNGQNCKDRLEEVRMRYTMCAKITESKGEDVRGNCF